MSDQQLARLSACFSGAADDHPLLPHETLSDIALARYVRQTGDVATLSDVSEALHWHAAIHADVPLGEGIGE